MKPLIKLFPMEPKLRFLERRRFFYIVSILIMALTFGTFFTKGLNFGVDFRGGILLEIQTDGPADLADLRQRLSDLDVGGYTLQEFGASDDVLINIEQPEGDDVDQAAVVNKIKASLDDVVKEYRRTEFVGPKVGDELKKAGLIATVLSIIGITVYIWFRFEWQFAVAALMSLLHDVIATVGFFAVTQIEFNLATLAAVLTVAGYSINDTVVVFDRVRENLRRYKKMEMPDLLNKSVNATLSRTILTSFTTLLALFALFAFGGEVIRGFTGGLIWGIAIGTYSSIFIAVPLLHMMKLKREDLVPSDEEGERVESGV